MDEKPESIPHLRVVVAVTLIVIGCFAAVSAYVLTHSDDAAIVGSIIGTWTALATSAGAFWLGASSGGKLRK